jgi:hypothetical protein
MSVETLAAHCGAACAESKNKTPRVPITRGGLHLSVSHF